MPNGGSDCCATCWFNRRNNGVAGYSHDNSDEQSYCALRSLEIDDPKYTYCSNHPWLVYQPERKMSFQPPIGPVYKMATMAEGRKIWVKSPDSEEIRGYLLELLSEITEDFTIERPYGFTLEINVILQLQEFNEKRALSHLKRIANFDPDKKDTSRGTQKNLINTAKQAIERIDATNFTGQAVD